MTEQKYEMPEQLPEFNYRIEERVINGKTVQVKVYDSHADRIIKALRNKREAASTARNFGGK